MSDKLMMSEIRRIYNLFQNLTSKRHDNKLSERLNIEFAKLFDENERFADNYKWVKNVCGRDWYLDSFHICRITVEYPHEKVKEWVAIINNINTGQFVNTVYLCKFIKDYCNPAGARILEKIMWEKI